MKIIISNFETLARRKRYKNGKDLFRKLGGGKSAYGCIKAGCRVGYEIVKELYNLFGVDVLLEVIDLEGETLNGFKSKYIAVGRFLC